MPKTEGPSRLTKEVGRAIRSRRAERRLTQQAVADLAGVSVARVSEIEGEKTSPRLATVERVCNALGLDVVIQAA